MTATDTTRRTVWYAVRCTDGPAIGLWWTNAGWGRKDERALYIDRQDAVLAGWIPEEVSELVAVRARWDGAQWLEVRQ